MNITHARKKPSRCNKIKRALNTGIHPTRQRLKDHKTASTANIIDLLDNGSEKAESYFPFTQEAMGLDIATENKGMTVCNILSPLALGQDHIFAHAEHKNLKKNHKKLHETKSEITPRAILSIGDINKAVKSFEKNLSKHYEIDGTDITQYCKKLKENLIEESTKLYNASQITQIIHERARIV